MAFLKGQSGNPSGRPRGAKDRRSVLRDMLELNQYKLVQKAMEMALLGNEQMLKLLLDRLLPSKSRGEVIDIDLASESLVEQSRIIIDKLSVGDITFAEANSLMRTISIEAKIYETEQLKKDVEILMEHAGLTR